MAFNRLQVTSVLAAYSCDNDSGVSWIEAFTTNTPVTSEGVATT